MAALNPGQFKGPLYHGTTFDIHGKDIKPGKTLDAGHSVWEDHGHSGQKSSNHAFATESENVAWQYGSQAGMMKRGAHRLGESTTVPDRVAVHEVAPHPMMQRGVFHAEHPKFKGGDDLKEWTAPAFRSKGTIDIMPGRQGTFPSLNWNQFRSSDSGYMSDMNHPDDHDVEHGHAPATGPKLIDKVNRAGWQLSVMDHEAPHGTPITDEHQMDLFSGKTVGDHAENDESAVGDYHRNNLFGRL